jgi:uncharacterized protein (DUF58 family)
VEAPVVEPLPPVPTLAGAPSGRPSAGDSRRPKPTANGWFLLGLAVVLFAVGLWLSYRELMVAAWAMVAAVVGAGAWLARGSKLEMRREVWPDRVTEGGAASEVLTVTNRARRRSSAVLAVERFADQDVPLWLPGVAPRGTHSAELTLPTQRRGRFAVGPLLIGRTDPLGLVAASQRHETNSVLWVHPHVHHMPTIPTGRAETFDGPTSLASPQGGVAFHSLRDWQPGDDTRMIHWRSTARTGTLMVRHTVITSEPRLLIVLDTSAASFVGDSFEEAVRVAASLVAAAARARFPTEFRTTSGVAVAVDPTGHGLIEVLDQLALVELGSDDSGLDALLAMGPRPEQGVSAGVVSGRPSAEKLARLASVRNHFEKVTLARLDPDPAERLPAGGGIVDIAAATAVEFAELWTARRPP